MAFSSLNMMSIEKPTILKGNKISHINGKRMRINSAKGQQVKKRKAQSITAMKVRIGFF